MRKPQILTTGAILYATSLALGWYVGYRAIGSYIAFAALLVLVVLAAWTLTTRFLGSSDSLYFIVAVAVISFALIVLCGLVLGVTGRLTLVSYFVAESALLAGALLAGQRGQVGSACGPSEPGPPARSAVMGWPVPRSRRVRAKGGVPSARTLRDGVPAGGAPRAVIKAGQGWSYETFVVAVLGALGVFIVAFGITHSPLTLYDSLSYHLFFSARWLQDHTLSIIPTPFSDEAQSYAPANGELFFLWLMLPFHGDPLARLGQLPFAALCGVTLFALGRRLGASAEHALYPPLFFFLSRPILEQSLGANVDLICAAMFLTSLYLGIVAVETNATAQWLLWGVSLGLYWGTKYVALAYTPVFLLLALARGPRSKALLAVLAFPGIVVLALPWHLRNWWLAGSPIYPASLTLAGVTIARGAFTRAAMLNSVFHISDPRLFPAIAAHGLGPALSIVWLPLALIGGVSMVRRGWWPYAFVALVPIVMVPLYWLGLPINVDSRFLMPAVAPALIPLAFVFKASEQVRWNGAVHVIYVACVAWLLVGAQAEIPATLPWFMRDWLALTGVMSPRFLVAFVLVAALIALSWFYSRRTAWGAPLTVLVGSACAVTFAVEADQWCLPSRCDYLQTTDPYIRQNYVLSWRWAEENITASTVAYTGVNLPYPLTGEHLSNRVVYVNIDGHRGWRLHEYDHAYRTGRFQPIPPALATSSGELMPVAQRVGHREDAVRPRYERLEGYRDGWIENLKAFHVTHLFIAALSAYEIDYVWHNDRSYPIEDEWAAADPGSFHLEYENPQVRIYRVDVR